MPLGVSTSRTDKSRQVNKARRVAAAFLLGGRGAGFVPVLLAALLLVFPYVGGSAYWIRQIPFILVLALVVTGVNLSFGYAGELQLGQVFMFALGSYVTMVLATRGITNDILLLMLIGGAVAVFIGLLAAIPALRIGGWALAMVSIFLVLTIPDLTNILSKYTGGSNGLAGIPVPNLLGHPLTTNGLYEVTVVTTILWFAVFRNLVTSRYGVVFKTLRESPVLTSSLGFSALRLKAAVYGLGAFPAGVAGCLFGYLSFFIEPGMFGFQLGIGTVAASLLGGAESVYGVLIGAAILQLGPQQSSAFASYAPVLFGAFLILAAVVFRGGLARLAEMGLYRGARWIDPELSRGRFAAVEEVVEIGVEPSVAQEDRSPALAQIDGKKLEIRAVSKYFGGVAALQGVSLTAKPGEVTALIGSNGSGKTTLLNVICGYTAPKEGTVCLDGRSISGMRPHQASKLGIGRTFQTPTLPTGVSVRDAVAAARFAQDHVGLGASIFRLPRYWGALRKDRREAFALLHLVGLGHLADEEAASLPLGMRRLVEVVRALCAQPSVLLLDEPASGLNDEEIEKLAALVGAVARAGATVIVIEHNFRFIRKVSDTIHVLHLGRLIASGSADVVAADPEVIESYLGAASGSSGVPQRRRPVRQFASGPRLVVSDLEVGYGDLRVLKGLSLNVMPGAIEVILGRNGVGKTTLLSSLAGLLRSWTGSITLNGTEVRRTAYARAAEGVILVQEGKRIFRRRTVWQNVMLGTTSLGLSSRGRRALCLEVLEEFPQLKSRLSERAGGLSGGQQQMVAIAQALAGRPKVLLLDEPSAGLAPTIVDDLFGRLRRFADEGLSIVLVEQLADKAVPIADHITVIDDGRVVAEGSPEEFDRTEKLEGAYFGL